MIDVLKEKEVTIDQTPGDEVVDVSVVIPIEQEVSALGELIAAYEAELDVDGRSREFIFVLDGISGPVKQELLALKEGGAPLSVVSLGRPFGTSVALTAGVELARGRYIVTSPAYLQIDPVEIRRLVKALDDGADFVTPWRHPRIDPWPNRIQSRLFNFVIRLIIRMPFHDLNCNFRAMRREVLEDISIYGDLYRFLPLMAQRQGFRVEEVQVRHLRERGPSGYFGFGVYVRRFLDILGVTFITQFTTKPLRFFGIVGSLVALIGAIICAYLTFGWFEGGEALSQRPILILGVALIVLGVHFIGVGLLGEIIIFTQARNLKEYKVERIDE
ncbi:MAG: glycosyltransferase [Planctomycetes bacterium]|nr:glycosyltransferase [Planctomycetota bacterium]